MSVSIAIDHVVKKFGDNVIIPDLTANIKNGELFTLLGPSGCGKTTLLRMIAGFNSIEGGTIAFGDQVINDLPAYKRNIGMVFQSYAIFPHLTVRRNVEYGLRLRNVPKDEMKKRTDEMLSLVHIDEYQDRLPERLSGGQQQRVALARILCSEPQAILLDEPFSALDSYLKWNLELELSDLLAGFHGPILWVSHDLGECCRNCQKVCVMENGASSPVTDTETLVRHPATQSAARLTGCRNFLPVRRCEGGVRLDGWDILLPLHAVGERATVAVPDGAITVEGGTHTARVSRVIRDLNATAVVLRAAEAPDAPPLCVVLPEGVRAAEGDTLSFSLLADRCRLWEE